MQEGGGKGLLPVVLPLIGVRTPLRLQYWMGLLRGRPAEELMCNGADGSRTHDLLHAMQALSQLSYGPGPYGSCRLSAARN